MDDFNGYSERKIKIAARIAEFEKNGFWDRDVADDPDPKPLDPNKVDYLNEKLSSKIYTQIANFMAENYFEKEIKKGNLRIKAINGIENFDKVKDQGVILTCNHFSIYDHYAVYKSVKKRLPKKHRLYKVIKEGNYTSFEGLFGFFFRHCNTLPLSENKYAMIKFLRAVDELLKSGEKILIYPEQALWFGYKKPRPLKAGAFRLAVRSGVPVLPVFITMEDSEKPDPEGGFVQDYTVWFSEPLFPKEGLSAKENEAYLSEENYKVWQKIYEKFYGVALSYES